VNYNATCSNTQTEASCRCAAAKSPRKK
jgi:hypothetical protein